MSMTPREHIDHLRKTKFSIGGELNPLTEDLHQAVKNLSGELYAKDVHFFMELIQNAEDNVYSEGVDPSLEFVITSCDITRTGAPATLLVFNNEKGFSSKNIDSICSVGRSTKKGNRKDGYIGEKGIGFKSVFLISARPYIFSNGYQIRFSEEPCVHCNVGYIVPEWVEQNPTLCDIKKIYGSGALPTTTLILPLKPDKVNPVKQQLSIIHPEVLLFLSKIRRLSVREDNEDPRQNTVNAIKIASETNFKTRKNIDAQSSTLHLSAEENNGNDSGRECSYYMWKQKFPVRQEFRVERRMEVDEWVITLAFPFGERLRRAMNSSPGVYAFLPTEMVTNFPFIIQADFLLASSRETILLDNKWNRGILQCVPTAFVNAFTCLVKSEQGAPVANLPPMFRFLPVQISPYPELNVVRDSIKAKLVEEDIIPVEPEMQQRFFHKPREVGRLMPAFWKILMKAKDEGLSLINISSHGKYILSYSFDNYTYDPILSFLGVDPVNDEWYVRCIQGTSKLVDGVSEDVYLELLLFISDNWSSMFSRINLKSIPLIKCAAYGNKSLCNISSIQSGECRVCLSSQSSQVSWLIDCNREFISVTRLLFLPKVTQDAIWSCPRKDTLKKWLVDQVKVGSVDVNEYAVDLLQKSLSERKFVDAYVHFLYHSWNNNFISVWEVRDICKTMPLVDNYGRIVRSRSGIIVPANGSKWAGLTNSNLWSKDGYVELGELYMDSGHFSGKFTPGKKLLEFLAVHAAAKDVPDISAPTDGMSLSAPLTKENSFLLLNWIRQLKYKRTTIPHKFLTSIKEGSWLRVTLNGSPGYRPPSQSFLLTSSWGNSLQSGSVFVDIPLIDTSFYGESISAYKEELRTIGVMFEYSEACQFIGDHLMSLADSSSLTRGNVYSILRFIKFLREKCLSPVDFINSIKGGDWLKTSLGYRSPVGSVLSDDEWNVASKVSNIPFVDQEFYGEEICNFRTELQLLGVVVSFSNSFVLIIDNLKSPSSIAWTPDVTLLLLKCLNLSNSSHKILNALKGVNCLKTNIGYKCPGECLLFHPEWGCILQIFKDLPLIDHDFYGSSIFSYRYELKKTGVVVDFEEAAKIFARYFRQYFRQHASSPSDITKEIVASFLSCYRKLKGDSKFPDDLKSCLVDVKWLHTRLGDYRSPRECILYSPEWESISPITLLPFIDDSDSCYGKSIHEFKKELKSLGVVVEFKEGIKFVASCLYFPQDSSCITPQNALALLECMQILMEEKGYSFPDAFRRKISHSWLKTHAGYRSPGQTLLFDSKFGLKQTDGPFIDEKYYGSKIVSYRKQLSEIGVIVEAEKGCPLIASHLDFHDEKEAFVRMYSYLSQFNWEPDTDDLKRIWIRKGEWVQPDECVIYDKDGLFGLQLTVLEKYFEQKLLVFFSIAFRVKSHPSVDDYLKLWKVWESSESPLSPAQCCKFWSYISKHWNSKTEKTLADALLKVPVYPGSSEIFLRNKFDVFIADDLQLKYLFDHSSLESIFVWYPQPSLPSLPRSKLLDIYKKIGVRTISESVQMEEVSFGKNVEVETFPREKLIAKSLLRLILGFLASPTIEMEAKKRHEAVQSLVNVTVVVTTEPITVRYKLPLSSGKVLNVPGSPKIRFDREHSKIYTPKIDRSGGSKSVIEFATFFSEAISESVLWDSTDHIEALSELIKLAFVLDFDEEAVEFLMKSKNLQVFMEDEEFLKSV